MIKSRKIFLLFLLFLFILGCSKENKRVDEDRFAFGTFFKISVFSDNEKEAKKNIEKAFDEIERIDSKYNSKVIDSFTSKLNENRSAKFDREGLFLLDEVNKGYELSGKKYDITIEPLMLVWGFSEDVEAKNKLPTAKELDEALKKVDFSKVKINSDGLIILEDDINIDTGSFLKGYAVQKASEKLKELGVKNGFISAISSIEAIGTKGDGTPWRIGVQDPNNPQDILGVIELNNQSMGVSGDYQTYIEIDDKRYHHILDKETKYPVTDKKMVVVVNKNALEADIYSTVFFLMPLEKVLDFVNKKDNLDVLIVDSNNDIFISENIKFNKK